MLLSVYFLQSRFGIISSYEVAMFMLPFLASGTCAFQLALALEIGSQHHNFTHAGHMDPNQAK